MGGEKRSSSCDRTSLRVVPEQEEMFLYFIKTKTRIRRGSTRERGRETKMGRMGGNVEHINVWGKEEKQDVEELRDVTMKYGREDEIRLSSRYWGKNKFDVEEDPSGGNLKITWNKKRIEGE